jgi:hypothetical protein
MRADRQEHRLIGFGFWVWDRLGVWLRVQFGLAGQAPAHPEVIDFHAFTATLGRFCYLGGIVPIIYHKATTRIMGTSVICRYRWV